MSACSLGLAEGLEGGEIENAFLLSASCKGSLVWLVCFSKSIMQLPKVEAWEGSPWWSK